MGMLVCAVIAQTVYSAFLVNRLNFQKEKAENITKKNERNQKLVNELNGELDSLLREYNSLSRDYNSLLRELSKSRAKLGFAELEQKSRNHHNNTDDYTVEEGESLVI